MSDRKADAILFQDHWEPPGTPAEKATKRRGERQDDFCRTHLGSPMWFRTIHGYFREMFAPNMATGAPAPSPEAPNGIYFETTHPTHAGFPRFDWVPGPAKECVLGYLKPEAGGQGAPTGAAVMPASALPVPLTQEQLAALPEFAEWYAARAAAEAKAAPAPAVTIQAHEAKPEVPVGHVGPETPIAHGTHKPLDTVDLERLKALCAAEPASLTPAETGERDSLLNRQAFASFG